MSLSSDEESSGSSGNEYLVASDKINFESPFFKGSTSNSGEASIANKYEDDNASDDGSDDDFDCVDDDNKLDSAALLAEVMKNLEKANNTAHVEENSEIATVTRLESPKKKNKHVLSNEIADLLLRGETGTSAFATDQNEDEDAEDEPPAEYTIPKEGVNIVLPGSAISFRRQNKCKTSVEDMLRKRMNQTLRSNQVYIHKTGLLCWLAHGFHLNREINDPEVLSTALSLVPSTSYPNGRADLKYLEQFTKWFKNLLKLEFRDINEGVKRDILLTRLKEKKVHNYRELVLLYIATLRAIGITCRLVVSLSPPALKLSSDQLFQNPKSKSTDEKVDAKSGKSGVSKAAKETSKKGKRAGKNDKPRRGNDELNSTIVPENSSKLEKNAKADAKKRAAEILAKFANASNKKSIKTLIEPKHSDKEIAKSPRKIQDDRVASPEKRRAEMKSPEKRKDETRSPQKKRDETQSPEKKRDETKKPEKKRDETRSPEKVRSGLKSPEEELHKIKSPPLARRLRSRLIERSSQSKTLGTNKTITVEKELTKDETKPTRRMRMAKSNVPSTSKQADSDSDHEIDPSRKKKRAVIASKNIKSETDSESDQEIDPPRKKKRAVTASKIIKPETDSDSDKDFEVKPPPKKRRTINSKKDVKVAPSRDSIDRRVLSSDDESAEVVDAKGAQNIWVEVYLESEESWISVSIPDDKIHCVSEIYKKAPKPVLYVVAWNSVGTVKDVTRRFCPHWLTVTRKQRVDENWWSETLYPWKEKDTVLSKAEDEMLLQRELEQPLPKTVGECKGHPLYALTRHLLKFEALYPPECVPLGHLRTGEAIYSRHCVHTLCSRETWIKKARVVKPAQEPYKIVKAMPKYDKLSGIKLKDQPLELFGKWQTTQYVPPEAKNGVVPRNEYGNVDLFQESMLPKGTVHINLPGLNRVARKLNIDCSPAVVGFNFGTRGALPAFEGFVVCEEFEDTLREAWESEQIEARKRAKEKREKRIYDNWKKLVKGLFIRERLAARYDFKNANDDDDKDDDNDGKKASASSKCTKHKIAGAKKTNAKKAKS